MEQVLVGGGVLRWAAFLRKLKPGGTFFQIWVVCQRDAGAQEHQLSAGAQNQTSNGLESDPAGRSGPVCPPAAPRPVEITAAPSQGSGVRVRPALPAKVTLWHLLDMTGREVNPV